MRFQLFLTEHLSSSHLGTDSLQDDVRIWCHLYVPIGFVPQESNLKNMKLRGFPGGAVVESLPANAGDTGSSPGLGRSHMPRSN